MTAQKVHFDRLFPDGSVAGGALCGTQPRGDASLTFTHNADGVTCVKCLTLLAEQDEVESQEIINEADAEVTEWPRIDTAGIASRHGLTVDALEAAFSLGFLKR